MLASSSYTAKVGFTVRTVCPMPAISVRSLMMTLLPGVTTTPSGSQSSKRAMAAARVSVWMSGYRFQGLVSARSTARRLSSSGKS